MKLSRCFTLVAAVWLAAAAGAAVSTARTALADEPEPPAPGLPPAPEPIPQPLPASASASEAEVATLVRALGDRSWHERERATARLLAIGREARPALKAALESDDAEVRYRARLILHVGHRLVADFLRDVRDPGTSSGAELEARPTFQALLALGADAVDPLVQELRRYLADPPGGKDDRAIRVLLDALGALGRPEVVDGLLSLLEADLQDNTPEGGYHDEIAAKIVERDAAAGAAGLLARLERAPDVAVRRNAIRVLVPIQATDAILDGFIAALEDEDSTVRATAAKALADSRVPRALDAAFGALDDPDLLVRTWAVKGLAAARDARLGAFLRPIVGGAKIDATLADPMLVTAIDSLGVLRDREAVPVLLALLERLVALLAPPPPAAPPAPAPLDVVERRAADVILALSGIRDDRAFAPLNRIRGEGPDSLKDDAWAAIVNLEGDEAKAVLFAGIRDAQNENDVMTVLRALVAREGDEEVGAAALLVLEKPFPSSWALACDLIGKVRYKPAHDAVVKVLESEDPSAVWGHSYAIRALADLDLPSRSVPVLRKYRADLGAARGHLRSQDLERSVDIALFRLGDEKAKEDLGKDIADALEVVAASPNDTSERNSLGILYLYTKEYDKAEAEFRKMLEITPDDSVATYNLACTYSLTGKTEKALEYLKRSIELGFDEWRHLEYDSDLDNIRELPEFKRTMEALKKGERP